METIKTHSNSFLQFFTSKTNPEITKSRFTLMKNFKKKSTIIYLMRTLSWNSFTWSQSAIDNSINKIKLSKNTHLLQKSSKSYKKILLLDLLGVQYWCFQEGNKRKQFINTWSSSKILLTIWKLKREILNLQTWWSTISAMMRSDVLWSLKVWLFLNHSLLSWSFSISRRESFDRKPFSNFNWYSQKKKRFSSLLLANLSWIHTLNRSKALNWLQSTNKET